MFKAFTWNDTVVSLGVTQVESEIKDFCHVLMDSSQVAFAKPMPLSSYTSSVIIG